MADIVERLREVAERADANYPAIMEQAADEITRLRAENEKLRVALKECLGWHDYADDMYKPIEVRAAYMRARAALPREVK